MSTKAENPYIYIDTDLLLKDSLIEIQKVNQLSVDLEFDKNRYRYGFNLCLIQIFDGKKTYLIDPISNELDLKPVFEVFENPEVSKIVFSFGEDLRLLHSLGCFPKGLYDLQLASGLLNFPPSSLANLLNLVLGIQISKSSQQSNWYQRPLTEEQIDYAIQDVVHLPEIYHQFIDEASKKNVSGWITQEMHHFESNNHVDANQNEILKEKYKSGLNEIEWHVFSTLMHVREKHAQIINRPPFHVAERKTLTEIAKEPKLVSKWKEISSNHFSTKNEEFTKWLEEEIENALEEAKELGLSKRKRASKRPTKEEYEQWKALEMKIKYAKQKFFKPIQKCIENEHGEFVKALILNNRIIRDLVSGHDHNLLPYKKKIILNCASHLQLDPYTYIAKEIEL